MKKTLVVRNWAKWQSYRRDRGQPPWIKLHRCLMRDEDWADLTDAQRGQLVSIWLLAADNDGVIPASRRRLQKLCFMDEEPDTELFVQLGFLEHGVRVTPERRQHDATETEAEAEAETEAEKRKKGPSLESEPEQIANHEQFSEFWALGGVGGLIPAERAYYGHVNDGLVTHDELFRAYAAYKALKGDSKIQKHTSNWIAERGYMDTTLKPDPHEEANRDWQSWTPEQYGSYRSKHPEWRP